MPRPASKVFLTLACFALGSSSALAIAPNAVAPAPSPSPALKMKGSSPLREIGRVKARTAFCQAVYDRGAASTATALDNDATLSTTSDYLNNVELDESKMGKPRAMYELQRRYALIMNGAHDAIEQAKALRALADQAPTAEQKAAIIDYADALGGALHRQELVAEYFRRFVQYLEVHEPVSWQDRNEQLFYAARMPMGPFEHSADPRDRVPPTLSEVARSEAIQITDRHEKVLADEANAAISADAAFGPCTPAEKNTP